MVYDPSRIYATFANGTFEGGTVADSDGNGSVDPAGWTVSEPAGRGHLAQYQTGTNPDGSSTENHVLRMQDTAGLAGSITALQTMGETIGADWETFTFEFDIAPVEGVPITNGDQAVFFELVDAQGNVVQSLIGGSDNIQTLGKTNLANGWQHFEQEFTVDPSWEGLTLRTTFYVNDALASGARQTTAMLIDNVGISYTVVCFARGSRIATEHGSVDVEDLREGDMVLTRDNGLQPIRWIGSHKLSAAELAAAPNVRPIRIRAGALGRGLPSRDLIVSPQHRVLIRSDIAMRMFSTDEVLIAAKHLLEVDGIEVVDDANGVEYFHFMFDQHEIVFSNGAETESLYTGPVALQSVSPQSREEILSLFPELETEMAMTPAVRHLVGGRQGRRLAMRHHKNNQYLVF